MEKAFIDEGKARLGGFEIPVQCILKTMESTKKDFCFQHYHEYVELIYGIDCDLSVWVDGSLVDIKSGDFCIVTSKTAHDVISKIEKSEFLVIKFLPQILYAAEQSVFEFKYTLPFISSDLSKREVFLRDEVEKSEIPSLIQKIISEWQDKNYGYEIALRAYVIRIALWLLRKWKAEKGEEMDAPVNAENMKCIKRAMEYAQNNFATASLKEASELCNLSYSYFSRLFKRVMGENFNEYVNSLRINEAKRMLTSTAKSVTDIAMECGFSSVSYFSKIFKEKTNVTPHKFSK